MFIEHTLDRRILGNKNPMMIGFGLEDIESFFTIIIIELIIIEEVIHIKKGILAHVANVPGCHPFRRIFHIFFA